MPELVRGCPPSRAWIAWVEWGTLVGRRPRSAGSNARLGAHGDLVRVPLLRLTSAEGISGFGVCFAARDRIVPILGRRLAEVFNEAAGIRAPWIPMEDAAPCLLEWAETGAVDVLQFDLYSHGLTCWLATGRRPPQLQLCRVGRGSGARA